MSLSHIFAWKAPEDFCVLHIGKVPPKYFAQGPPILRPPLINPVGI